MNPFKVGDRVRVLKTSADGSYFIAGQTFIIRDIAGRSCYGASEDRYPTVEEQNNRDKWNYVSYNYLELVRPKQIESHMPEWF